MVVEYKVADLGWVRYYLAPKASGPAAACLPPPACASCPAAGLLAAVCCPKVFG